MTTYENAIDLMYGLFKTAFDAGAGAIVGGPVPYVQYEGITPSKPAPNNKIWARLFVRNVNESQATLGSPDGPGKHEYESVGFLTVQLFLPKDDNGAIVRGRRLAQLVRNAYRSVSANGEVWFRDATIRERPPEERWYVIDISVTYEFMETV